MRAAVILGMLGILVGLFFLVVFLTESVDTPRALLMAVLSVLISMVFGVAFLGLSWVVQAFDDPPPNGDGPPRGRILHFRAVEPHAHPAVIADEDRPERAARAGLRVSTQPS